MAKRTHALSSGTRVKLLDQGSDVYMVWSHSTINGRVFYCLRGLSGVFLRESLITTKEPVTDTRWEVV